MRTLEIDIRFDGGDVRIKKASGVTERRTRDDMKAMLRLLWRQPAHRHIVLELSRPTAKRSVFDVYTAYLAGKLADLTPSFEDHALEPLIDTWLAEFQASASHIARVRQALGYLMKQVKYKPKLTDLPALLETYRTTCVHNGTPRAFNYAKQATLALLRDKVGKRHPLRGNVADVPGMPEAKQGVLGMSAAEARAKRDKLIAAAAVPENPNRESLLEAARIWWSSCTTGMGPTEYWGEWSETDRVIQNDDGTKTVVPVVRIVGTKRPGRRWGSEGRDVPRTATMARPQLSPDFYAKLLRKYAKVSPYQARKTFACAMEDGEIMRTVRRMLLGHGAKDVTDRYEKREITSLLADARTRLLKQFGQDNVVHISKTHGLIIGPIAMEA